MVAIGDIVRLKVGGDVMLATKVTTFGDGDDAEVKCLWWDRQREEHVAGWVSETALEIVSKGTVEIDGGVL